jgi:protein PhnA
MNNEYKCPKCNSDDTYQDVDLWVCLGCHHEWNPAELVKTTEEEPEIKTVFDSNKNILNNGDSVLTIKDLKVKGSASGVKAGTKVKNIMLVDGHDGHNISCKIDGVGAMYLKSEFVKKV